MKEMLAGILFAGVACMAVWNIGKLLWETLPEGWWHRNVTHRIGLNRIRVVSWIRRDGAVMVATECQTCGKRTGIHPAVTNPDYRPSPQRNRTRDPQDG